MGMLLSVVIPSHNGRHLLEDCLASVERAAARLPAGCVEILVVDDASDDSTLEWLTQHWREVKCVRLSENGGFAAAANAGIARARGEWVALLNNDTEVDALWIISAARHFDEARTACVASRVLEHGTGITESAGDGYTIAGLAYQGGNGERFDGVAQAFRTFSACAAAAFYRRSALDEVGLFEVRLESYYEDVDLGFRLNLRGFRTICEPASICYHHRGSSYGGASWRKLKNSARNSETVFFSCMPRSLLFKSLPAHLAATLAQGVWRAANGGLLPFLAGKIAFLFDLPWVLRRRRRIQSQVREPGGLVGVVEPNWFSIHIAKRLRLLRRGGSGLRTGPASQAAR